MVKPHTDTMALVRCEQSLPQIHGQQAWDDRQPRILDAGVDNVYFSYDLMVSDDTWYELLGEQEKARATRDTRRAVYISEWLNAQVSPMGASGYPVVIMTDGWLVRLQTSNQCQPGIFIEMRSFLLHTHPGGVLGACEDACQWVRDKLLTDVPATQRMLTLAASRCSRLDLHCDWQGGWFPSMIEGEQRLFIKPGHTGWNKFMEGNECLGYVFGKKRVQARVYNKTKQANKKHMDWYHTYIQQRGGAAYSPMQNMWRLEFELKREGIKGFYVETTPDVTDDDRVIDAEIAGEDLPHVGSVPKAIRWSEQFWVYLTKHWLRLVMPGSDKNKARWPLHPTWEVLQDGYALAMGKPTLAEPQARLVRLHRHSGYSRALKRMAVGIMAAAESLLDSDPASVLPCFIEQVLRQAESALIAQRTKATLREMGKEEQRELRYLENVEHLAKMALGVFTSVGVTKAELPPMTCVADLLEYLCDDLEEIAAAKGGISRLLFDKWCKLYKMTPPAGMFTLAP